LLLARSADASEPIGVVGEYELGERQELDVGRTLPAAGEWSCDLRFADGAAPAAIVASLTTGDSRAGLMLWRAPQQRVSLLPGNYALHVMGDEFAWIDGGAVEVASDQRSRWSDPLERASAVRLSSSSLPRDVDEAAGLTIARAEDGRAVGHFALQLDVQRPQVFQCFLGAGKYFASVERTAGCAARAAFELEAAAPQRIDLRFDP
jgi:hypothetical protein